MITEKSRKNARKYCSHDVSLIEGYDEAMNATEKYSVHHVLEYMFSPEELDKMGMYYNVHEDFLIWMPFSVHHNNCVLHKTRMEHNKKFGTVYRVHNKKEILNV